ncbi:hypothetical protein WA026_004285 [Henosepilachna vigintioctopunctata]|uniref:Uncharacterized protein n=1 Tax=Henosepilachna vigintioctopunctata TaxID=420089 RepID=A0AAW1V034_9CUCU
MREGTRSVFQQRCNHYPSIRCKHLLHRTQLCGALYPVSTATQNTTELVVRLRRAPRWTLEKSDGSTGTTPASAASISCANYNCEYIRTQFPLQYRYPTQLIARWPFIRFVSSASDPSVRCKITVVREKRTYGQPVLDTVIPPRWTQERSDGSTETTPASPASISCANFNLPSFHCNTDTLPN